MVRVARAAPPRFSRVEASPPLTREFVERIRRIPQHPREFASIKNLPFALREISDYLVHATRWLAPVRRFAIGYPAPFRRVEFPSLDGTKISAWLGVHHQRGGAARPRDREAILIVPGMFTTKENAHIRKRALRFFREWGYHVLILDSRGTGESSGGLNTAGWKESEDVEAAVEYLRSHVPVEKLHVFAESMGAVATILAAARKARRGFRLVDGAILAFSPYPDARQMISHLMRARRSLEVVYVTQWFFTRLLTLSGRPYPHFEAYLRDAAKTYGATLARLYKGARAVDALATVNVPMLIVCSDDDPLVPPGSMRAFSKAVQGRSNPAVLRLSWGGHCLYEQLDPAWFWHVVHEFFDFYCVLPLPGARKDLRQRKGDSVARLKKPRGVA